MHTGHDSLTERMTTSADSVSIQTTNRDRSLASRSDPTELAQHARELADAAISKRTARAYTTYWRAFERFCAEIGAPALPATKTTVLAYLASLSKSGRKTSTISVAYAAIRRAHAMSGAESPCDDIAVRDVMRGIRRRPGMESAPKRELRLDDLRAMVSRAPAGLRGVRNVAVLLFGWWSAMRRSEIVAVNVEHVSFSEEGMTVRIPRSKTNQSGDKIEIVAIPYASDHRICPVRAVQRWMRANGSPVKGPLFTAIRSGQRLGDKRVWTIIKDHARLCGIDPDLFGAHSLRSGFATEAARAKKRIESIRGHLRHASIEMTMRYVRKGDVWDDNAATGIA